MTNNNLHVDQSHLDAVAAELRRGARVLVITGAGISADSGLPTYRGVGGLYDRGNAPDGVSIEQALSGAMMARAPAVCWRHIGEIESACRGAVPNSAHTALAQLQAVCDVTVLTQNVDGFHRAAGSRQVIEMHGNLHALHCVRCPYERQVADYAGLDTLPPRCPDCGALVRPRVVLFGEMLPDAAVAEYHRVLRHGIDVVIAVGTTAVFPYICAPVMDAARRGLPTVEINPDETELSPVVSHRIGGRAAAVVPRIVATALALG